jgi:nitrite reductase (NADH) large subunit
MIMSAVLDENLEQQPIGSPPPVVVVGTGPVGIRFVEELLQRQPGAAVVIYGNEPWEPYNRVRLAGLLTGETSFAGIQNPLQLAAGNRVLQQHNCAVIAIDRARRHIVDRLGRVQAYSQLLLATGSRPHIPNIAGVQQGGIFTFRNLNDAQELVARRTRCRRAVVLGGGLLGLEAARGLQKFNTQVVVIEHAPRLMAQQLDDESAELLRAHMMSFGIQVVLGDSVKRVVGTGVIEAVELRSGRIIDCDTLVIATGIQPNLELAREADIAVGRGIRVNDRMQTSDEYIYAVGECVEHRERIYGLAAPGFEQAAVAAHQIAGGESHYAGSQAATRLKVAGVSVFSAGRTGERDALAELHTLNWRAYNSGEYRKILLKRNRLAGVIAYGDWDESSRVQEAVQHGRYIWFWQRRRFHRQGKLWAAQQAADVNAWPASAIVCQCTNVTRGTLSKAFAAGHCSVEALRTQTGAASVCGSCRPLLAELAGGQSLTAEAGSLTLLWGGGLASLLALLIVLAPAIPYAGSVQVELRLDTLWRDALIKQISGFSLLALGLLVSLISLRKRVRRVSFGSFSRWRSLHVLLGILAVLTLVAHTGLRLGHQLNAYLMLTFVSLLLVGGLASGVTGLQHRLPREFAQQSRSLSLWAHILLIWPLPVLLGFHILKVYWF